MKTPYRIIVSLVLFAMLLAACATPTAAPTQAPAATEPPAVVEKPTEALVATEPPVAVEEPTEEPAPPAEEVTIRMLVRPDEGGNVAKFAEQFKQETGINVAVDFVGWAEIHDKTITTLASGGGGYDIVFIPNANAFEFASGGWFEPIDDLIPEAERELWLEAVVDMYTYEGNLIAMPWYSGGAHFVYNSEILEKAGVNPEEVVTWDDFMAACGKIKETGAAEFCFSPSAKYPGNFYYNFGSMVRSQGESFFDAEGNPTFQDGEATLKVLEMIDTGIKEGYFDPAGIALDDYETLIAFGTGKTAFMINSTWSSTQANRNPDLSGVTDKAGYILIPGSGDVRSGGYLYAGGLGLLKTSENKDAAKQFLVYLTGEEAQKHHAIEGGNLPTRVALFSDAEIGEAWPGFEMLAAQLPYGEFPPKFLWFEEWRRSAATAVQDVMGGRKTAQEALDWLVEETTRLKEQ